MERPTIARVMRPIGGRRARRSIVGRRAAGAVLVHHGAAVGMLVALLLAACSNGSGTPSATAAPATSLPSGEVATAAPSEEPLPSDDATPGPPPGQSETAWGRIWDDVPDSFPVPVDASVADPLQGPISGAWTVPVADVDAPALVGYYRQALDELGWTTAIDGPLEDGSYTVASANHQGCGTLTTILPRGDESLITVLFGAGCPFR